MTDIIWISISYRGIYYAKYYRSGEGRLLGYENDENAQYILLILYLFICVIICFKLVVQSSFSFFAQMHNEHLETRFALNKKK